MNSGNNPAQTISTVLVVDDDGLSRELLSRRLKNEGYAVSTASDGDEAIKLLGIERYNLLLLDLNMPGTNGFDVLEWLQTAGKQGMGVIMLTASGERDTVNACLTLGADDYVLKSAAMTDLIPRVNRACESSNLQAKHLSENKETSWHNASILLVDDNKLNLQVMKRYFDREEIQTYSATDGFSATKILEKYKIDLVLLDYNMEGMNGLEVLEYIRQGWEFDAIGVIMVTAETDQELIASLYKAGADDYIGKPFHAPELINRTQNVLHDKQLKQKERRLAEFELLGEDLRPK